MSFFSFSCGSKKIVFETGLHMAIKLQLRTLRINVVRRHRKVGRGPRGGSLLFVKVSTKLDIHSLLTGSAAGPLAWSEIDPAHRAFDARGPTKPNFQRPDRAGQRCKCRLVCEWVCTVTSVSVRIEKRANCAKNNKPKSGGLFLVNARPFPEHSSSRATFSAGRAWLEASASRGAASFLATESTGTVLIPRLMTRIAGHDNVAPDSDTHLNSCSTEGERERRYLKKEEVGFYKKKKRTE